jgi:hypothetical protein
MHLHELFNAADNRAGKRAGMTEGVDGNDGESMPGQREECDLYIRAVCGL